MEDFDLTGQVPLRISRFRSIWSERGCVICRHMALSNPYAMPIFAERGRTVVRRCEACGCLWLQTERASIAITQEESDALIAADPVQLPPWPSVIDVVSEPPGEPDETGRWTLPPYPQGDDPWRRNGKLWEAEALAMVADVLLGEVPGSGRRHRFTMQRREEVVHGIQMRMDAYGTSIPISLDWDALVARVNLARAFTRDTASEGTPRARAVGTNTALYSVRGPGEIVTTLPA
jgi:hypothetical protein